jgi:hypothetical protein
MNNEDVILLGREARDETEDFINRHFENQNKGWPKVRLYDGSYSDEYKDRSPQRKYSNV